MKHASGDDTMEDDDKMAWGVKNLDHDLCSPCLHIMLPPRLALRLWRHLLPAAGCSTRRMPSRATNLDLNMHGWNMMRPR